MRTVLLRVGWTRNLRVYRPAGITKCKLQQQQQQQPPVATSSGFFVSRRNHSTDKTKDLILSDIDTETGIATMTFNRPPANSLSLEM